TIMALINDNANAGTSSPEWSEPARVDTSPVSAGSAAAPTPDSENVHFDFGESCMSARILAMQRGKIGPSIRPVQVAVNTVASGACKSSNITTLAKAPKTE